MSEARFRSPICTNTMDRIKKAYRKKALDLHPDRNYGNIEETTEKFAAVQSAYEILSDPQERAWYDTHRDAILRDEDDAAGQHYDHNVRITTADDILRMLARLNGRLDYSGSATGFYGVLGEAFEKLAREEQLACQWEDLEPIPYPSFGGADDSYNDVVKPFYAMWNGFATKKTFSWMDIYRYSEAPDRRVRRMMEKENRRFREEGIKEFNDAVRSLVAFVKKRDPRFKHNVQSEAERQNVLKDAAAAQAARSRMANQVKQMQRDTVPEWMQSHETQEVDSLDEAEEAVGEQVECVLCKKNFKSEKQYESHEKSKKHLKAVQYVRRQMRQDDKNLRLDAESDRGTLQTTGVSPSDSYQPDSASGSNDDSSFTQVPGSSNQSSVTRVDQEFVPLAKAKYDQSDREVLDTRSDEDTSSSEDGVYASREKVEGRILNVVKKRKDHHTSSADIDDISEKLATECLHGKDDPKGRPKLGKAKEKRAKKAAKQPPAPATSVSEFKCAACQAGFHSRTRLFNHIKDLGHAQAVSRPWKSGEGK